MKVCSLAEAGANFHGFLILAKAYLGRAFDLLQYISATGFDMDRQ
jgi:hypothetical protein